MAENGNMELSKPVAVCEYLFTRLYQMGVRSIHGVPGDFNMKALDYVTPAGHLWVGNCNELNAGYAADGYARVKGIGALVTKCGVGELSAVNALAGSFSEYVPVVHIVGTPSTTTRNRKLHPPRTLANGSHTVFESIASQITCGSAVLDETCDAAKMIDDILERCWLNSRPVYISLPLDIVSKKIEGERLDTPLRLTIERSPPVDKQVLDIMMDAISKSTKPVIITDVGVLRRRLFQTTNDFVRASGFATVTTPIGKGSVDESLPNFLGVYSANSSVPSVRDAVENADLVIAIGSIRADSTAGWCRDPSLDSNEIGFDVTGTFQNGRARYSGHDMGSRHFCPPSPPLTPPQKYVLEQATALITSFSHKPSAQPTPSTVPSSTPEPSSDPIITHSWLWPRISTFLRSSDVLITETGTTNYGIRDARFPPNITAINQPLWSSIGFATAACQGAALAAREIGGKRTILFTGEGSFQVACQELSTMIRHKLTPIIFVVCNGGYTTERFIHGMDAVYNDVQEWRYTELCHAYGGEEGNFKTYKITAKDELESLLDDPDFSDGSCLRLVEMHMMVDDAPDSLLNSLDSIERG